MEFATGNTGDVARDVIACPRQCLLFLHVLYLLGLMVETTLVSSSSNYEMMRHIFRRYKRGEGEEGEKNAQ